MKNNKLKSGVLILAFFVFLAGNLSAQTQEQIDYYTERIQFGTEDVKRNALSDLRNFESESASRVAVAALRDNSEIIRATATHSVVFLPKDESAQVFRRCSKKSRSLFVRRRLTL